MKLFLFLSVMVASFEVLSQTSYVAPTKVLGKKGYQLGVSGDYFKSSKRIDRDGNDISFGSGESFDRIEGEVFGHYGLADNFQVGIGTRFRQNQSTMLSTTTGSNETETSNGIESVSLGLKYAFRPVDRLQYSLEGLFRYRPFTNEENDTANSADLILGDDGTEYGGGIGVTYSSRTDNYLTLRTGLRQPGKELSMEVYWQLEGAMAWKHVALVAGVDGVSSLKSDPHEEDEANRPLFNTGATTLYNSPNREWIAPYAGINFALGKTWRMEARGSQVVSGRSTDLGTAFGVSLIRRVDDSRKGRTDQKFKDYDFEASVTKISPKKGFIVIDKGLSDDVQKGMKIDFFEFDYVGGNILLARGVVVQTKSDTSIIKITQTFNSKRELKVGVIARGFFR